MIRPPKIANAAEAKGKDAFFLQAGQIDAWFERRSDVLIVSFYNLATVGEHEVPHPWFYGNIAKQGYSVLGLIAKRRDWYRNTDTPQTIEALRDAGLFKDFRRVLFVGASMGGFAALTYSKLVPGSGVLAFSPQSSLAPQLVPFEGRYGRAQRRFDWSGPEHCDAAEGIPAASDVTLVYDPFVPEDKAHAKRLSGPNVRVLHAQHMGHQAIRVLKHVGVLPDLFSAIAEDRFDRATFFQALRGRRTQMRWLRELFGEATRRNHHRLVLRTAKSMQTEDPRTKRYLVKVQRRMKTLMASGRDHAITVQNPKPQPPYTGQIFSLAGAFVVPGIEGVAPRAFGVLHSDGRWCKKSQSWISARLRSKRPDLPIDAEIEDVQGTHLFGGYYRGHFGHFLVEALSRLWALDHVPLKPKSVIYIAHGSAQNQKLDKYQAFYQALGINIPILAYDTPVQVEHLYVPELGFGWGGRFDGAPAFHAFVRSRLGQKVEASGGPDLYISRSKLWGQMGQVIGEQVLEQNLEKLGYEVFHPQEHSIESQLSRYKSARRIVALDGSALHLVPFICPAGGKTAIIKRRSSANVEDYQNQFRGFCRIELDVIDALKKDWILKDKGRVDFRAVGELDFAATFAALERHGYVPAGFKPDLPTPAEVDTYRDQAIAQRGGKLHAATSEAG